MEHRCWVLLRSGARDCKHSVTWHSVNLPSGAAGSALASQQQRTPPGLGGGCPGQEAGLVSWDMWDSSLFLDVTDLGFRVNVLD